MSRMNHTRLQSTIRGKKDHEPMGKQIIIPVNDHWKKMVKSKSHQEKVKATSIEITPEIKQWLKEKGIT